MGWDITENMMQELTNVLHLYEKSLNIESPYIDKITLSRFKKDKGLLYEINFKSCYTPTKKDTLSLFQESMTKLKSSPNWKGMIHWYQRGFFLKYIFKSYEGKIINEYRIDRKNLFWKPFSQPLETDKESKYLRIHVNGKTISFLSKNLKMPEDQTPGLPYSHTYCNIKFNQERYFFKNNTSFLTVSIIKLSGSLSDKKQLQCINEGDLAIQTQPTETLKKIIPLEKIDSLKNNILSPAFKIIEYTENKEEVIYALSSLIENHIAIYFSFASPNTPLIQKQINEIIASVSIKELQPNQ